MSVAALLLADGFETSEALTTADVLRRAGIKTRLVSTMGTTHLITAQQIQVTADTTLDELACDLVDCYVLPGGLPGVKRLAADQRVRTVLETAMANPQVIVAAICAAPSLLAELGLLGDRPVTVFPGCTDQIPPENLVDAPLVVGQDLITARSMSCSLPFALAIVERLAGTEAARKVLAGIGPLVGTSEVESR